MKKILVLLTVLGLLATPAMASTHLEKKSHQQTIKHHVQTKHAKKKLAKREKKHAAKKIARRNARKHKVAV